ncbi:MAG: substrate-binding domain-containing protein [Desulfotalea sp.]
MKNSNPKHILIIDSDRKTTYPLQRVLLTEKYVVEVADTLEQAKTHLETGAYDLVLANPDMESNFQINVVSWVRSFSGQVRLILIYDRLTREIKSNASEIVQFEKPLDYLLVIKTIKTMFAGKGFTSAIGATNFIKYAKFYGLNQKTKTLVVLQDDKKGIIFIQNGLVTYSKQGKKLGEEALNEILSWQKAKFNEIKVNTFPESNISQDINVILNNGSDLIEQELINGRDENKSRVIADDEKVHKRETSKSNRTIFKMKPKFLALSLVVLCFITMLGVSGESFIFDQMNDVDKVANLNIDEQSTETINADQRKINNKNQSLSNGKSASSATGEKNKSDNFLETKIARVTTINENRLVASTSSVSSELPQTIILRLHGSNTIGAKLAPALAEQYLKEVLGAEEVVKVKSADGVEVEIVGSFLDGKKIIEIKAHGSSTGFKDLNAGLCDVAMSSRKIKSKEIKILSRFGDMENVANEHILALDGVAVIVNKTNPISSLGIGQIAKLFSGSIIDWKDLGGEKRSVQVYSRDNNSGTYDTFKSIVLGKKAQLVNTAKRFESNSDLASHVAVDPSGVGFTSLSYVKNSKGLAVADSSASAIYPSFFTVATEDYPLSRRLYLYTPASSKNDTVLDFIEFSLSQKGQEVVKNTGFVDMNIKGFVQNIDKPKKVQNKKLVNDYLNLVADSERLSLNFRFRNNSTKLDNRALRDLDRMVEYLRHNMDKKIVLVGFADNAGEYNYNLKLAKTRAATVNGELKMRGLSINRVMSVGEDVPVASNITGDGRDKNRRVEVWVK